MLDPLAAGCRARLGVRTAGGELRLQLRLSCPPAHADSSRIHHTRYTVGNAPTQVKEADSMDPVVEMQGTTPAPTSEEIDRLRLTDLSTDTSNTNPGCLMQPKMT